MQICGKTNALLPLKLPEVYIFADPKLTVEVLVTEPEEFGDEVVARITQVMSVKDLSPKPVLQR